MRYQRACEVPLLLPQIWSFWASICKKCKHSLRNSKKHYLTIYTKSEHSYKSLNVSILAIVRRLHDGRALYAIIKHRRAVSRNICKMVSKGKTTSSFKTKPTFMGKGLINIGLTLQFEVCVGDSRSRIIRMPVMPIIQTVKKKIL